MSTTSRFDVRNAQKWEDLYASGDTGWDVGDASPPLVEAVDDGAFADLSRVFVPGCGRGHDAVLLAKRGHKVTACDFAPSAIDATSATAVQAGVQLTAICDSVFSFASAEPGSFDAAFEYTCFCAIDPADRDLYVEVVTRLVRPGGLLLFLVFPLIRPPGAAGPPHLISIPEVGARFGSGWEIEKSYTSAKTIPPRVGSEAVLWLRRK